MKELLDFFTYIYGSNSGHAYLALKNPNADGFEQLFFNYPVDLQGMAEAVLKYKDTFEVYYAPALFKSASSKKEDVKSASVFWVEFDGNAPKDIPSDLPSPSLRIQSSIVGHEHWYWRTEESIQPYDLERVNRALTYRLGSDTSGWDASQILRPVGTFNHKRGSPVELLEQSNSTVDPAIFSSLPEPPPLITVPVPTDLPAVEDVIRNYRIPDDVWTLFKQGKPQGERSEALMQLGYMVAEIGMENDEVFAIVLNADMRWGKFRDREDQYQRIAEIVTIARNKYPVSEDLSVIPQVVTLGFNAFLQAEYNFEWIWDGYLQRNGYLLITGPSGVGKTQFCLDAGMHFALGTPFLERQIITPKRIGILSLEMGGPDLQFFLHQQAASLNTDELAILDDSVVIAPVGEPIFMDQKEGQEFVEDWVHDNNLQGVIIDSLGSAMSGDVSAETPVKNIMAWNDRLRQKHDIFSCFIHHHRKATGDNKKPNKLQDVYGNQYITARATTVICLWELTKKSLQVIPLKTRLTPDKEPFNIHRDDYLRFSKKGEGITIVSETTGANEVESGDAEDIMLSTPGEGMSGI